MPPLAIQEEENMARKKKRDGEVVVENVREIVGEEPKVFEVSLKWHPTLRVLAADEAAAWEAFKEHMGILSSDHTPQIVEVPGDGDGA